MTDALLFYRLHLESRLAQRMAFLKEIRHLIARESSSSWNNPAWVRDQLIQQISMLEVQRDMIRKQISKLEAEISSLRMLCTSQARGEGVIAGGVSRGKVGQVAQHLAASATTE